MLRPSALAAILIAFVPAGAAHAAGWEYLLDRPIDQTVRYCLDRLYGGGSFFDETGVAAAPRFADRGADAEVASGVVPAEVTPYRTPADVEYRTPVGVEVSSRYEAMTDALVMAAACETIQERIRSKVSDEEEDPDDKDESDEEDGGVPARVEP